MNADAARRQLEELVAGRRGWHLAEPEKGQVYAWRTVEIVDVAFHLFVERDAVQPLAGREMWTASFRSVGGSQSGSWSGTYDEVLVEIAQAERCLDAVNSLRECQSRLAAHDLIDPLKGDDVRFICDLLDLSRWGVLSDLRRRIVSTTCGFRLDAEAINQAGRY